MSEWAKHFRQSRRGFTIVELLIVIVVIGILATVVFVGYNTVISNANDTKLKADISKLGDEITLVQLDQNGPIAGGATSTFAGNSTILPGLRVQPDLEIYDTTVTNLFYCAGDINGTSEFAIIARGKTGNAFYYSSNQGVRSLDSSVSWSTSSSPTTKCNAAGFGSTFTWSYGFHPSSALRWFAWANKDARIIKNLALNPKGVGTVGWFVPITGTVTDTPNVSWGGKTDWHRFVWNGTGATTVRMLINLSDLTNGRTYTGSFLAGNSSGSPVTWSMDFADEGSTAFTLAAGETRQVYFSASRATYDATFRFLDFNISSTNPSGILVSDVMVTEGTDRWLFRGGSSLGWSWDGTANQSTSQGAGQK